MARSMIPFGFGTTDPIFSLHREMNRLFDDVLHAGLPSTSAQQGRGAAAHSIFNASMDVSETEKEMRVTVELPGVTEQDIDLSLDDDLLTLSGEKKIESERGGEKENFHFVERSYGCFQRSLRLPFKANPDEVRASFANGILTITVPKSAQVEKSRKIRILGAGGGQRSQQEEAAERREEDIGQGPGFGERDPAPGDQPGAPH